MYSISESFHGHPYHHIPPQVLLIFRLRAASSFSVSTVCPLLYLRCRTEVCRTCPCPYSRGPRIALSSLACLFPKWEWHPRPLPPSGNLEVAKYHCREGNCLERLLSDSTSSTETGTDSNLFVSEVISNGASSLQAAPHQNCQSLSETGRISAVCLGLPQMLMDVHGLLCLDAQSLADVSSFDSAQQANQQSSSVSFWQVASLQVRFLVHLNCPNFFSRFS